MELSPPSPADAATSTLFHSVSGSSPSSGGSGNPTLQFSQFTKRRTALARTNSVTIKIVSSDYPRNHHANTRRACTHSNISNTGGRRIRK